MELDQLFSAIADSASARSSTANSLLSGAISLYQKGRYKDAIGVLKQATAYQPALTDAYNIMGQAYTQLNDNKNAIAAYKISLKLDNTQGNVQMAMGNIYMADQNYTEAEKSLKLAAKSDPTSALPVYTLGLMYKQQGRNSEAEAMFKQAAKLSPKDGNPHYALGSLYNQDGRNDEAVSELKQALQLKPDFPLANSELGNAYVALGETDLAQDQLDILKTKDSTLYNDLKAKLDQPKILGENSLASTFVTDFGPGTPVVALDAGLLAPQSSKDFTVQIQFDRDMDPSSVTDITNWNISKASRGTAGLYDNGLYRPTDAQIPFFPKMVIYDPSTFQATLTFSLSQNDTGTATIDPSHVVFKFMGKDIDGKSMDPSADQYDKFAGVF